MPSETMQDPAPPTRSVRRPRHRRDRRGLPSLALLVTVLVVGATALAITSPSLRPLPAASVPSPDPAFRATSRVDATPSPAAIHPSADVLSVLETISTQNGTVRPGNQAYSGGYYPLNVTADGDLVFAAVEYSDDVLVINATTGGIIATEFFDSEVPVATAYDSLNGGVYVADYLNSQLEEFNPTTGALLGTIALPAGPAWGIQFDALNGLLIVTESQSGTVAFVSPATGTVVGQAHVGGTPIGLTLDSTDGLVYVADTTTSQISVVSTTTFAVVATLSTPGNVTALQYDPANGDVYAAFFNILNVSVYDAVTHTLTTTLALGDNALTAATYVPDSDQVILVDSYGGLYTIAGGNNTWTGPVAVDSGFIQTSIAYSAATHLVFEPEWAEFNVTGFNYTTGAAVVETYLGEDPQVAVVDPFNNVLFVANTNTNTLVAFSLVENRVLATISLSPGVDPDAIVYDPSDGLLYVAEGGTNTVTIVNPLTDAIVRAVGVGGYPFAMVYDAADNRLFVANFESANLTVISGSTGLVTGSIALTPRSAPYTETLDTVTDELYVVSFDYYTTPISSNITAVAASTGTPGPQFTIPNEVLSAGFDPTTSLLYLDSYTNLSGVWTGSLVAVDPATGATVQTLPNTEVLAPGAWDAAAGALLVPDYTSNTLEAIVGSPVLIVGSVPVGYGPFGVTIDPGYGLIFVVNQWSSSVTELSLSSTPDSLAVAADPAFCGPVSVNDSATSSAVLTSGSYPLSAPACYGYSFQGWVTTGAVAVAADALSTQVTVTGNGTVEATYSLLPGAQFAVDLGVSPASCGSAISVDGTSYGNAASAPLAPGNHTISAASCSGYLFSGWQVSGNVALLQVTGPMSADLSVVTNGTLNATYVASGSTGPGSGSTTTSGYSAVEVYALVAAGILGGALVGVLVGRRGPPRSPPRTSEPSTPSN